MRLLKGLFNTGWGEDSNPIPASETPYDNNSLKYHARQLAKGLLVFGAGLLGYVGFSVFYSSRRDASTFKTEKMIDGNLVILPKENLHDVQAKIRGISPYLEHQSPKWFVPTSFSTARTLLSLKEKEEEQSSLEWAARARDSVEVDKEIPALASTRRAAPQFGYQGGSEFQVNNYTTSKYLYPTVSSLADGSFVVVWANYHPGTSISDTYCTRYSLTGLVVGYEFKLSSRINFNGGVGHHPVTELTEGGFVVVWHSNGMVVFKSGLGVYGQRYTITGQPIGAEFQVSESSHQSYPAIYQDHPVVTSLIEGGFVVVWHRRDLDVDVHHNIIISDTHSIYGQRYNAKGQRLGPEFRVKNTSNSVSPSVTSLNKGGFVVVWTGIAGDIVDIYGQRYSGIGESQGSEFRVNTYTHSIQETPDVSSLTDGDFVVVWQSRNQDGNGHGVYGQGYKATGHPAGTEFQVNTYTTSAQRYPSVTSLTDGGFVVVWSSVGQDGGSVEGVYGQRYKATGQPLGAEFRVNTSPTYAQGHPSVTSLIDGVFVVVWQSRKQGGGDGFVYGRIFSPTPPSLFNNALTIGIITGSILGGACLYLTASAILLILPAGIWVVKRKQGKNTERNTVEDISEQETELEESFELTEKQVNINKGPSVTSTQKGFFQPPKTAPQDVIGLQQTNKPYNISEDGEKQTEILNIVELRKIQTNSVQKNQLVHASAPEEESESDNLSLLH